MKKTAISILLAFLMLSMVSCSSTDPLSGSSGESSFLPSNLLTESEDSSVSDLTESENHFVSVQYEIGDIILADGSVVKEEKFTMIDSSNLPIAVIAGFLEDGTAFGLGVHRSDTPLQWAADSAFHFVDTYAETYGLCDDMVLGWYMPSIEELYDIYQNREAVNKSLKCIYRLDNDAAMNGLETNWYWSSSQAESEDDYAWFVHYFNGYAGECPKNFTNLHVLAIRIF